MTKFLKIKISLLICCLACAFSSHAQNDSHTEQSLEGQWIGTAAFLNVNLKIKLELKQKGNELSGSLYTKKLNSADSSKKLIKGSIESDQIILKEVKYVYKYDGTCLSTSYVKLETDGEHLILSGKWKGDWKLNSCLPSAKGPIVLYRRIQNEQLALKDDSESNRQQKTSKDALGIAIENELKRRKYHALLIGVSNYQDMSVNTLVRPVQDAESLASVLTHQYNFEPENVSVLQNPNRTDIISSLDHLASTVAKEDNLLIFYAGHGIWDEQLKQGYWLPSDASTNSKANWISNSTIRDYLRGIPAKHTLLISDACFSGGILSDRAVQESSRAILEMYKKPSRKAMTSGTMTTVPDNSVFIAYLLKNLKQNNASLLSADQLFRQFKIAVIHNSPSGQLPQYGVIREAGDEGGDFIFLNANKQ